jgi:tRNA(adenine34) deaminase
LGEGVGSETGGAASLEADEAFMGLALAEARAAAAEDEVPIGAVIVRDGVVLGSGRNATRAGSDPTAHAEILAVRAAAQANGYQRLDGCTVYSTVEPCFMCAGALVHARVARLVFGVRDPKFGGVVSLGNVLGDARLNHRAPWTEGVCAGECRELLVEFFRAKRAAAGGAAQLDDALDDDGPAREQGP